MDKELYSVETYDFYGDEDFQAFLKVKMPKFINYKPKFFRELKEAKEEWIEMLNEKEREKNNENEY